MRGLYASEKEKQLNSTITVTPQTRTMSYLNPPPGHTRISPQVYSASKYFFSNLYLLNLFV